MGEPILIYGKSGSGKSRSLLNFGEDEIFLVNVLGKRLPFAKKFKYTAAVDDIEKIKVGLKKMPTKAAVIDDAGYLMTNLFMRSHGQGDQYKLFNTIADTMWGLMNFVKNDLPEDVLVYIVMHENISDLGESKLRTIGKLLDDKVSLEGMVTICLRSAVIGGKHVFVTNSNGTDIAKSPEGLWDEQIPNDLKAVDSDIRKFWGIK
jgi:hypothetical protein